MRTWDRLVARAGWPASQRMLFLMRSCLKCMPETSLKVLPYRQEPDRVGRCLLILARSSACADALALDSTSVKMTRISDFVA